MLKDELGISPATIRKAFGLWNTALCLADIPIRRTHKKVKTKCTLCKKTLYLIKSQIGKNGRNFCSQSCAATYSNINRVISKDTNQKRSVTMKKLYTEGRIKLPHTIKEKRGPYVRIYWCTCICCKKNFWAGNAPRKTCSKSCRDNICSQNKVLKKWLPYYNMHEKKYVKLHSTWEVKIAEWLDNQYVEWYRPTTRVVWFDKTLNRKRTYLPDFYLLKYNMFVDVKNDFKIEQDKDKLTQLQQIIPLVVGNLQSTKEQLARLIGLEPTCVRYTFKSFEAIGDTGV